MNAPVASVSIRARSMAGALNCQSKSASVLVLRKCGLTDPMRDAALTSPIGLLADHGAEEVQVREALTLGPRHHGVELLRLEGDP